MASLASLPVELHCRHVQYLDVKTLKNLRLVSRTLFPTIGAEKLFETHVLRFNAESCERFSKVLGNETLKPLVKTIIIDGQDGDKGKERDDDSKRRDTPWGLAIPKISQFPALRAVEFWFHDDCAAEPIITYKDPPKQDEEYRRFYQGLIFDTLDKTPSVDNLTLKNIQDALITLAPSTTVQGRLKKLALMILTESETAAPEEDHEFQAFQDCFKSGLLRHWLEPTQTQLTHLTIYCDLEWGVHPFTDLRKVHFPQLKSLAFGTWTIMHDWQIDWITSHGGTLMELVLDRCPIVYVVNGAFEMSDNWPDSGNAYIVEYSTRWSDVLSLFQQHLKHLKHFGMTSKSSYPATFDKRYELQARFEEPFRDSRYIHYQCATGPSPWTTTSLHTDGQDPNKVEWENENGELQEIQEIDEEQYKRDEEVLCKFLEVIRVRKRGEIEGSAWNWDQ